VKRWTGAAAPVAAIVSAVATIACCLPLGFLGALGAAGLGVFFGSLRPWLLGLSVVLLGFGFFQYFRGARCGVKRSTVTVVLLWVATLVVLLLALFPQPVASFLADRLGGAR
jgi:hypothetical protein